MATGHTLRLVHFDRPARLHGDGFDLRVAARAAHAWIDTLLRPPNLRLHFYREILGGVTKSP